MVSLLEAALLWLRTQRAPSKSLMTRGKTKWVLNVKVNNKKNLKLQTCIACVSQSFKFQFKKYDNKLLHIYSYFSTLRKKN